MKFSVIIPTYKREQDLNQCLRSVFAQTRLPDEIIIIDDDNLSGIFLERFRIDCNDKHIRHVYFKKDYKKYQRGSAISRNIGIEKAAHDTCFILDDDLVLELGFFDNAMRIWEENKDDRLLGVAGVIVNNRKITKLERLYNSLFLLRSKHAWDITRYGFQVWDDFIKVCKRGYYSHGGVCSYNKQLVTQLGGFIQINTGRAALEDIDFCIRVKKLGYHFRINPHARVSHYHAAGGRDSEFRTGKYEGENRLIIFYKYCHTGLLSTLAFIWSYIGWTLRQFLTANFSGGLGMLSGLLYMRRRRLKDNNE